ncbi:terephthalate 1,2-dioxygenase reductase TphA1I [Comamonas thiooxydans]|uniref:terephthalate 1,2-dioxygenase reductase TphA1I n=1 Tax=Comamonas thiooxydans TaxID=363952 RepID=UPI0015A749AC|nr:FAD-binding oxidoreductase [Comamonas thiooxydans]
MNHQIHIHDSDIAFPCAPGQSVLDAALQAGIELPYSCRKGSCGNCASTLLDGNIASFNGMAVRNELCASEQVLLCGCTAASDIRIHPSSFRRLDPEARKRFTAKVYSNALAAPDVSLLRLRLPAGKRAKFEAGQYLLIHLDDGKSRSYSMANPPHESDGITLHIRHVPGGRFSTLVQQLKSGDTLEIELPFGSIALKPDDSRPLVCVAGGTGFAPIKSVLDDLAKRKVQRDITLIWGARNPSGLYLPSAIDKWRKAWPQFRYIAAITDLSNVPADAHAGRVDDALRMHFDNLHDHVVHCCGSPALVQSVRTAASSMGLLAQDFHADVFATDPTGNH